MNGLVHDARLVGYVRQVARRLTTALAATTSRGPSTSPTTRSPTHSPFPAAAHGALEGSTLRHPAYDLALELPVGWKIWRTPEAVGAVAPGGDAIAFLQRVAGAVDPVSGGGADGLSDPLIARLERIDISGLPAVRLAAETREGERVDLTWIAHRRGVVRFAAMTEVARLKRYRNAFESALKGVRPLSATERDGLVVLRLRVRPARAGETVDQVVARNGGGWSAPLTAIANEVGVGTALEAGWPMKITVRERFSAPALCLRASS